LFFVPLELFIITYAGGFIASGTTTSKICITADRASRSVEGGKKTYTEEWLFEKLTQGEVTGDHLVNYKQLQRDKKQAVLSNKDKWERDKLEKKNTPKEKKVKKKERTRGR